MLPAGWPYWLFTCLEIVHVEEDQGHGFASSGCGPHGLGQLRLQATAVLGHGEVVLEGQRPALLQAPGVEQQGLHILETLEEVLRGLMGIQQPQEAQLLRGRQREGLPPAHQFRCLLAGQGGLGE